MPHDELAEHRELFLTTAGEDETVYYQCPNGHRYEIGECGRPWTLAKCLCGADIGGRFHTLLKTNKPDDGSNQTMTGHCIGDPGLRQPGAVPERLLTGTQSAMIRLLLHCSMYLGCARSREGVCRLIKPNILEGNVYKYIWRHIFFDIADLRQTLSLNTDDVMIFVHGFIDHISRKVDEDSEVESEESRNISDWLTKENRRQWEFRFAQKYCEQFITEKEHFIEKKRKTLQASNKLLSLLAENAEIEKESKMDINALQTDPKLWMFRKPLSISHLKEDFQRNGEEMHERYPILWLFLNKEKELQAIRFIPRILLFHNSLLRRYNRAIYKSEASKITVAQLKKEKICGDETESLIDEIVDAWNLSRHALKTHVFKSEKGPAVLPPEILDVNISDDTTIDYLLPSTYGKGVLTFAILDWLLKCHNTVMEAYEREHGDYIPTTIHPKAVTSAHLIIFNSDNDLLPIILSNCSMNESGTIVDEYDFETIEQRVAEMFISTKSKVVFDGYLKIDLMKYRSEITVSSVLDELERKIPQERFEIEMKTALCSDLTEVPLVNHLLSNLDIVMSFLNVTGGNGDDYLNAFMVQRLKMSKNVLTPKMQQACMLKHVRSLWMTLSFHRSIIMARQKKPVEVIFENVDDEYRQAVPEEIEKQFTSYLRTLSNDRSHQLIDVLFEFINIELTKKQSKCDEDYIDMGQLRLRDCLIAFAQITSAKVSVHDLPTNILCIHASHTWIAASKAYTQQLDEQFAA